jgi:Protein of unknown function (DUF2865)
MAHEGCHRKSGGISSGRSLRFIRPILLALLALAPALAADSALANVCRSIQAELAAIGRPTANPAAAARASAEAGRIYHHMRSIGCDRSGLFALGAPPPAECVGLRGRMHQLQQQAAAGGGSEGRRRELMGMLVTYNCRTSPRPEGRGDPLVAGLFDDRSQRSAPLEVRPDTPIDPRPQMESRVRSLGGKTVCVRTCDGYFFPVSIRPGDRRFDGDEICQSLCPAAPTKLYSMRGSDIADAVSMEGERYDDLDNAFLYRKRYDPACLCRNPGEGPGGAPHVLNADDPMEPGFEPLNGDAVEEPPLRGLSQTPGRKADDSLFGKRQPPAPPHPPSAPTAERVVGAGEGEVREFEAKDGTKRTVRIIAPELSRGPSTAAAPSAPDRAPAP